MARPDSGAYRGNHPRKGIICAAKDGGYSLHGRAADVII